MEQQATGKRAAIYIRVSSEGQALLEESVSLDEQTRDIEDYASERGYDVTHCYQDVEFRGIPNPAGVPAPTGRRQGRAVRHHYRVES